MATPGVGPEEWQLSVSHYRREETGVAFTISIFQHIRDEIRLMCMVKGRNGELELVRNLGRLNLHIR